MIQFNTDLILLDGNEGDDVFPEKFSNEIYYSNEDAYCSVSYESNISIKYIINGTETYRVGDRGIRVHGGTYLLVNDGRWVECLPGHGSEAISVFLNKNVVQDVINVYGRKNRQLLDLPFEDGGIHFEFMEYPFGQNDLLGAALKRLHRGIMRDGVPQTRFVEETYFSIAEAMVFSQDKVRRQVERIDKVKRATREELFRRLLTARDFLASTSRYHFNFDTVCAHSGLSKFHLIRLFKSVFGITPYRYYLHCKVEDAKKSLRDKSLKIHHVAYDCGFTDVYSFSKRFKGITGISPSQYRKDILGF